MSALVKKAVRLLVVFFTLQGHGTMAMAVANSGVVRMVTLKSGHQLWTRTSTQGTIPILLVHGGPGGTWEFFENFEQMLAPQGFQVIVYDQLDSYHSDKSNDPTLWTVQRFSEEIEEVRQGLGLEKIYLLGYSWGAVLALEYAVNHQEWLRGLILSGFPASAQSSEERMQQLRRTLPPEAQQTFNELEVSNEVGNKRWQATMEQYFYPQYFCRLSPFPQALTDAFVHLNWQLCFHFFGKNDFVVDGALKGWDRWPALAAIKVPSLVIVGEHDLCSVGDATKMAALMPQASAHMVPNASHVPFFENQDDYFSALQAFLLKQGNQK